MTTRLIANLGVGDVIGSRSVASEVAKLDTIRFGIIATLDSSSGLVEPY